MSKKLRIITDLDATAVCFFSTLWRDYERATGEKITTDMITHWDMMRFVKHPEKLVACFHAPGFFHRLEPMPGAIEALRALHDDGHEIVIASSPCTDHSAAEKLTWCRRFLPFVPIKRVAIIHEKHMLRGDVLVDDGAHNADAFREANPEALILGISHPYNQECRAYDALVEDHREPERAWASILACIRARASE